MSKRYTVDATGLACPMPVIETKRMIESLDARERGEAEIQVIVDNETANANVTKFAASAGFTAESKERGGVYFLTLRAAAGGVSDQSGTGAVQTDDSEEPAAAGGCGIPVRTSYFFATDKLGEDPELGASLMKTFLFTLSESPDVPEYLIFLNSGVKLTTADIPALAALEQKGVRIFSCGACLNYFGLEGMLKVGAVSNMYEIVEKLNRAAKVIRI